MLSLVFSLSLAGCGTLLHPHRNGHHGDRVDPAIVLLDGALLLFFVVPGLVAYGIDFYTGAIYLPRHGKGHAHRAGHGPLPGLAEDVCVIQLGPGELTEARVEALVREHTGAEFRIDDPRLQRLRMEPARGLRMLSAAGSSPAGQSTGAPTPSAVPALPDGALAPLAEGLPFTVAELENPSARVPWDPFTEMLERASELLGGPDQIENLATARGSEYVPALLRSLRPSFVSARPVYVLGARWVGPWEAEVRRG